MKKTIIAFTAALILTGCSSVLDMKFDGNNTDSILVKVKKSKDLTTEDITLLTEAVARYTSEHKSLVGKRVIELLKEQRKFRAHFANYINAIKDKMNDPRSAQFRHLSDNGYAVCGEFNGKNQYGGYVGYTKFFFVNGAYAVIEGDSGSLSGYVIEKLNSEAEVLQELINRKKHGDKRKYSDNEINDMIEQLTFDRVFNKVCVDQTDSKTNDTRDSGRP